MVQLTMGMQTRQQISLTPRLQQSVKLLQMSTLEFNHEMIEAVANNPFLEEQAALDAEAQDGIDGSSEAQPAMREPQDPPQEFNTESGPLAETAAETAAPSAEPGPEPGAYSGDYPQARNDNYRDDDLGSWVPKARNLADQLRADLCGYELSQRDRAMIEFIIDALDSDGYLRTDFSMLTDPDLFNPPPSEHEWTVALTLVQQLNTPGLAARNLAECLALQLDALPSRTPGRDLARGIVETSLEKVGSRDYRGLAKLLKCREEDIKQACALIRTLDPRPGARFAPTDPASYIVPDTFVRKVGKLWVATSNPEASPQLRVNHVYAKLFRQSRGGERAAMANALKEARWLMRSLEQRTTTIQRVAEAIVARQQTFFDYGPIALRPMMLSEIAEELELHESTVSRATSNKYLASPAGVHEFKYFFSRELATRTGGTCSAMAVRALIREMIDEENPQSPLSDVVIAEKLAKEGVVVARRTVSKYRAQLKCPPAELRRAV